MKTLKPEMETTGKGRKRSNGKQQEGRTKFPLPSREITASLRSCSKAVLKKQPLQSRILQLEPTETELATMKMQIRNISESVMAARQAAEHAEAEFTSLIARRNELKHKLIKKKNKLLKIKAIEAFVMLKLGSL